MTPQELQELLLAFRFHHLGIRRLRSRTGAGQEKLLIMTMITRAQALGAVLRGLGGATHAAHDWQLYTLVGQTVRS